MSVKSSLIKKMSVSLRSVISKVIEAGEEPKSLVQEYSKVIEALDSLLRVNEKVYPAQESREWYVFQGITAEGLDRFEEAVGETVSVMEASSILGIRDNVIRNILHASDYLVAVKGRGHNGRQRVFISRKSVEEFKKKIKEDPMGDQFATACYASIKIGNRIERKVVCCDESLGSQLEKYIEPC